MTDGILGSPVEADGFVTLAATSMNVRHADLG
jgi:hypothetical protein